MKVSQQAKKDLKYDKLGTRDASRAVKPLNSESLELVGNTASLVSFPEICSWRLCEKFMQKEISQYSGLVQFFVMSLLFAKSFVQNYLEK